MRCSALPLASKCRGSYKLTQGYGSIHSRLGQAFHEAARAKVLNEPFDRESLCTRYALTDDELKSIDFGIYNLIIKIPEGAIVLADDAQLLGLDGKLSGTPDLAIYHKKILTITDWKSGWGDVEDPETNNQTIGYAALVIETLAKQGITDIERIQILIVQPKLNQVKSFIITPKQLKARVKDLRQIIDEAEKGKEDFITGPWCMSCFKNMNCPAFAGQVKTLATFIEPGEQSLSIDVEKALKILLPISKACATVSRKIDVLAKAWVDNNGPLDLGGDHSYVKVIDEKEEINVKETFETLKEYFRENEIWSVMSASMTEIKNLARKVKRGLSTIVKNRMIETGALTTKPAVSYRIIKGGRNDGSKESGSSK